MAGSSDIRAGKSYIELSLEDKFSKALDNAQKKLTNFGKSVTAIGKEMLKVGVAITGPLAASALAFSKMGDEINKASQRTGVGVEALSALKYAAERSGASFEDLQTGLKKMQNALFEAEDGNDAAIKSFASLGLTISDLKNLSPEEQFSKIAERLSQVQDAGARAAISMELFGKGGTTLLPLILEGSDGIAKLTARAKELGLVMSSEDAQAATKFGDALADVFKQLSAITFQVGSAVARALQPFVAVTQKCLATVIQWVKENKNLVTGILIGGVALVAAGTAVIGLGLSFKIAATAMSGFRTAFSLVGGAIGLLTNPIVLVIGAIAALGAYFLYGTEVGNSAINFLKTKFGELADTVKDTVGGISDALAAGDISLAAQILWVGVQKAFLEGTKEIQKAWIDFKAGFVQVAAAAFYGALEIYQSVKTALANAFQSTSTALANIWDGMVNVMATAFDGLTDNVAKGFLKIKSWYNQAMGNADTYAAEVDQLENQSAQNQQQRDLDDQRALNKRETEKTAAIKKNNDDRDAILKKLNDEEMSLSAGATAAANEELRVLDKKGVALQAELKALKDLSATEKKNTTTGPDVPEFKKGPSIDDIINNRQIDPVKVNALGTFSAQATGLLGGGQVADKIAKNTEDTANKLDAILKKGGITFGK